MTENNKEYTEADIIEDAIIEGSLPDDTEIYDERFSARKAYREKKARQRNTAKEILSWIACLLSAVIIATVLRTYVFEFVKVDGDSMLPTLTTGEAVFVEKISKRSDDGLEIGDIIIVHYPEQENKAYVKRIVGLPGDTLCVKNGILYRNGEAIKENYTFDAKMDESMDEYKVPEDNYFVMGDNRNDSWDSRSVGSIHRDSIVGHALCVIWPLNDIKGLN